MKPKITYLGNLNFTPDGRYFIESVSPHLEYCGMKKPLVRIFEPPVAEIYAGRCIEESHRVILN